MWYITVWPGCNADWTINGILTLTLAETHYAQIEKELLTIVCASQHYDACIYGREKVQMEAEHKSLVPIMQKPLI